MSDFIPKWHKELEIFSKIKPLIIVEGNVLDVYSYPEEGSIAKGSILRLTAYMHYFFKDLNDMEDKEIISGFIKQFYIDNPNVPNKIILKKEVIDFLFIF